MPRRTELANHEIVTLAVFKCGGQRNRVDTEDAAMAAAALAPGRFSWRKYPEQVNLDAVRKRLWDAKKAGLLLGTEKDGWMLTADGLEFAQQRKTEGGVISQKAPTSLREKQWEGHEKARLLTTAAYRDWLSGAPVNRRDLLDFFRIDEYVAASVRDEKVARLLNTFGDDPELGGLVRALAEQLAGGNGRSHE